MPKGPAEKAEIKPLFERFSVLGLDTSSLISANWPYPSVDLDNVVVTCRELGIPVLIPEVVLTETCVITLEKTAEAIQKARDAEAQVGRRLPDAIALSRRWPSREDRQQTYDAAVGNLERRWGWVTVPVPDMSLREAVERSARHELPFATTDTCFRDSVIVLSLSRALKRGDEFGFIAGDSFFSEKRVVEAFAAYGIKARVFKTSAEAWTVAEDMARATALVSTFDEWQKQNDRLREAINADRERMELYVREHLTIPEVVLEGRVLAVHGIRIGDVASAHMPMPSVFGGRPDAEADVEVKIEATITRYTPPLSRSLHVGDSVGEYPVVGSTETISTEIDGHTTLTLEVTWPSGEGALPKVEYVGIAFETAGERNLKRITLQEALAGTRRI